MKNLIILCFIGLVLGGCQDFLTVPPEGQLSQATYFKQPNDFVDAVNAAYDPMRSAYDNNAWLLEELHSDNTYFMHNPNIGAFVQRENIANFGVIESKGLTTNTYISPMFDLPYLTISRCNQILATIDNVAFSDPGLKNSLKGQSFFLRAFAYFSLVRIFGKVPLYLKPVSSIKDASLPLSSVDSVYDQIEKDDSLAISMLPTKSAQDPGKATIGSARMLLADVYMVKKDWSGAVKILQKIIDSHQYSLLADYGTLFTEKNNAESIFEIQNQEGPGGLNSGFVRQFIPKPMSVDQVEGLLGVSNPQPLTNEGINIPTPNLIAAYEPGDLRKDASIGYVQASGPIGQNLVYPYIKKYIHPHEFLGEAGIDFPVYRYAETLLFMAEALNELGETGQAASYINQVRNRAGLENTDASTQADMRTAIYHERQVEFAFENKRWFTLVRTDRVDAVISAYGEAIKANPEAYYYPSGYGGVSTSAFTNLSLTFPLPASESELNPYF